jgi:hypothetical protein
MMPGRSVGGIATASIFGVMAAAVVASTSRPSGYRDDSFEALRTATKVIELHGPQGWTPLHLRTPGGSNGIALDARRAIFEVSNSRNPNPTEALTCDQGQQEVNRYPLVIEQQDRTAVVGGLFLSRVPQTSEWRATYCNSAAITFQAAPDGIIDGVRITGAWDAIRIGRDSPHLLIRNSWISNARDDAIENDFLQPADIRDTLIDGAFQGISVKPPKSSSGRAANGATMSLSGVVLRLREYPYKGEQRFGALMKSDASAPASRVVNSVIAVDYAGGRSYPGYWTTTWSKLTDSSNNLFLWLSDAPIPDVVFPPSSSFKVLRGELARQAWARAKSNWINCHPRLSRLPSDPKSNFAACVPGTWGAYAG